MALAQATAQGELVNQYRLLQSGVMLEETAEQSDSMMNIIGTTSLTTTMHGKLWVAKIESSSTEMSGQHRTDSASTARVISNYKKL